MVKRKLNDYFKLMLKSKKQGAESFEYGGNHYDKIINEKTGMILYKKRQTKPSGKQTKPKQQDLITKMEKTQKKSTQKKSTEKKSTQTKPSGKQTSQKQQQSCTCPKNTKKTEKKIKSSKK